MSLRFLCDENIDRELVTALTPEFETTWVVTNGELETGIDDVVIWTYAVQRGWTVLTEDDDFVNGAVADMAEDHPGVIRVSQDASVGDIVRALRRIRRFVSTDDLTGHTFYVPGDWL